MLGDSKLDTLGQIMSGQVSRRQLLKRAAALGVGVPAISGLLAACADEEDLAEDEDEDDADADSDDDTEMDAESDDDEADADTESDDDEEEPDDESDDDDVAEDEPQEGGEVRYHYGVAPRTLNPLFSTSNREHSFQAMMFGGLVKINNEVEAIPDLAEEIEVSDDATEFTFTLYDNILFTDGEQLTSDDVRFTYELAINPETGSVRAGDLLGIAGAEEFSEGEADSVEGISTPDELTVGFTLANPNAVFLLNISGTAALGILPMHVLEDVAPEDLADHDFSFEPTVSAGPYKFVRYETDQFIEWERHEEYFGDRPYVDRIFALVLDPNVAIAQLETGDLDIIPDLEFAEIERVEGMDHVTVHSTQSANLANVNVNLNREYLADKRVRQAMAYAIDNDGILESVIQGNGEVVHQPFVAPQWAMDIDVPAYDYDPDRAMELLEEAGWDSEQAVELWHREGWTEWWLTTLTFIQDFFADVGIQLDITAGDTAIMNEISLQDDDFDLMPFSGSSGDPDRHSNGLTSDNLPPDGTNRSRYSNERVDELFQMGRSTTDPDERAEVYTELAQILNDELPSLYLFRVDNVSAYANRVGGVAPPAYRDNTLWNASEWYIVE